jgi:HAD superfamily hydrolase (TIGR01509 family)
MIIFDLDGTLTVPVLDFDAIRAEIGLPPGPILESLDRLDQDRRDAALAVLHRHEERAAHESMLQIGARETIEDLRNMGFPIAVLTRNARRWARVVFEKHGLKIDALRTRDDGVIKPSPEPITRLCAENGADPAASWMVGDHLFDLQSGNAAGCLTVLMVGDGALPDYIDHADHVITALPALVDLVAHTRG